MMADLRTPWTALQDGRILDADGKTVALVTWITPNCDDVRDAIVAAVNARHHSGTAVPGANTPAPWRWENGWIVAPSDAGLRRGILIYYTTDDDGLHFENEADRPLVLAAPDMLAAIDAWIHQRGDFWRLLHDAAAKARGTYQVSGDAMVMDPPADTPELPDPVAWRQPMHYLMPHAVRRLAADCLPVRGRDVACGAGEPNDSVTMTPDMVTCLACRAAAAFGPPLPPTTD